MLHKNAWILGNKLTELPERCLKEVHNGSGMG